MTDDAPSGEPTRADAFRLAIFLLVIAVAGVWALVAGLRRPGSDGVVFVVLGGFLLLCLIGMGIAAALVRRRDLRLPPAERAAARRSRYAEARARRPAWLDSPLFGAFSLLVAVYWGWFAVAAARREVLWLAAVDALLCVLSLRVGVRVLSRRRASSGS